MNHQQEKDKNEFHVMEGVIFVYLSCLSLPFLENKDQVSVVTLFKILETATEIRSSVWKLTPVHPQTRDR